MEERKKIEIEHYDKKGDELLSQNNCKQEGDFEGFNPFVMSSYQFLPTYLRDKCYGKELLDYGCGNGVHSFWIANLGAKVIAIDLSEKLLEVAKKKKESNYQNSNVDFISMDCEKLDFNDNSFDIIFNGGSFSSLDLTQALPELSRVLKPNGFLLGIETFGHNPIANLKRKINKILGKRTGWAASHIFSITDLELSKQYFSDIEIYYFHIISWLAIPFLKFKIARYFLNFLELLDKVFVKMPFLKKYAFKVVFIFKNPKK